MAGWRSCCHVQPVRREHRGIRFGHVDGVVLEWQLNQWNVIAHRNAIVRDNDSIAQIVDNI
jgi:hypothetical protein